MLYRASLARGKRAEPGSGSAKPGDIAITDVLDNQHRVVATCSDLLVFVVAVPLRAADRRVRTEVCSTSTDNARVTGVT